jgi:hypothetical protein
LDWPAGSRQLPSSNPTPPRATRAASTARNACKRLISGGAGGICTAPEVLMATSIGSTAVAETRQ